MRFFVAAVAVLVVGVAYATSDKKLNEPKFVTRKSHIYHACFNITAGILGMDAQVSKSTQCMEVKIYAKTSKDLVILIHKLKVSGSLAEVPSATDPVDLKSNPGLEERLKVPITCTIENGMITKYTLDEDETPVSLRIKKAILRNLQVQLGKVTLTSVNGNWSPLTYNVTRSTPGGNYVSHYVVTSSPYPNFPYEKNVVNISRTDNFEVVPYLAYHTHHNFEEQGCPGICKKDHVENPLGAGCPAEWEPYKSPMSKSFVQHHNLRGVKSGGMVFDEIITHESHVADVYDQNMEVKFSSQMRLLKITQEVIPDPGRQHNYEDLNDWRKDVNEEELHHLCKYPSTKEATDSVKTFLSEITQTLKKGGTEGEGTKSIGEKLVRLQKALRILNHEDLKHIQDTIVSYESISRASVEDKIKRQIWLDVLPLIGTPASVTFIVELITKNGHTQNKFISVWEAKSILEALPENIMDPNGRIIEKLKTLVDIFGESSSFRGHHLLFSAVHLTIARVIRRMCSVSERYPHEVSDDKTIGPKYLEKVWKETFEDYRNPKCPKTEVKKFIQHITEKLKTTTENTKTACYIESLTLTGLRSVLPILKSVVYGNIYGRHSLSDTYYMRTMAIYSLHNLADRHPEQVKGIIFPVFLNRTEPPRVRTACFSVFMRTNPSVGDMQHVADMSWKETSLEVGSFVRSTLETYGNSSHPCDQKQAQRIKKILPQVKSFHIGYQHAQNIQYSLFDEIRDFGLKFRYEMTPSNESFFPSAVYSALGYNEGSMRDTMYKFALHSRGFTSRNMLERIIWEFLGLKAAADIPKEKEHEIFSDVDIISRDPDFWQFTFFQKIFYSSSYYYFDSKESQEDVLVLLKEHFSHFMHHDPSGSTVGHLVKVFIPSSYQSRAMPHALPYPVQFEMTKPIIISLKVKVDQAQTDSGIKLSFHVDPSVYFSSLYTNEVLNLGDCKHFGVYHETKTAFSYPFVATLEFGHSQKIHVSYSFPELPKKIFTYNSTAGTYAGRHHLDSIPSIAERRPIKTIPSLFVKHSTLHIPGLPPFVATFFTEDMKFGHEQIPRTQREAIHVAIKHFLNAGWRRKSYEIKRVADSKSWDVKTKVLLNIRHDHRLVEAKKQDKHDEKWSEKLNFDDHDEGVYSSESLSIRKRVTNLSHIHDKLSVTVEKTVGGKKSAVAHLHVDHNRTFTGELHYLRFHGQFEAGSSDPFKIYTDFAAFYLPGPNEFKYGGDSYGKQKGLVLGSLHLGHSTEPYMIGKILLDYKSLEEKLNKELYPKLSHKHFLPEMHEQCLRDVKDGKSHTPACLSAIREYAIYNRWRIHLAWQKELPQGFKNVICNVKLALLNVFFNHLIVTKTPEMKGLTLNATYIDKLTDEPLVDFVLNTPTELITFRRVGPFWIQPVSSIYSVPATYVQHWTNNTYPPTCTVMEKYIRTYDMKTYHVPKTDDCPYLMTSHCMEHKKFAVLVHFKQDQRGVKKVILHIGTHTIEMTPGTQSKYSVKYDGRQLEVKHLSPVLLDKHELIYAVTNKASDGSYYIEIHCESAAVTVKYDGTNVKTYVDPRYKGELCGLCSEFNGEVIQEMRGPNKCLYSSIDDFVKSTMVGTCGDKTPQHPHICGEEEISSERLHADFDESGEKKEYVPRTRRNRVVARGSVLCFSIEPVPVCEKNDVEAETESMKCKYHCLPKSDKKSKKLFEDSHWRILGELENKSEDWTDTLSYPTKCFSSH